VALPLRQQATLVKRPGEEVRSLADLAIWARYLVAASVDRAVMRADDLRSPWSMGSPVLSSSG
jgi:hypothetical protein